jgi:L-rhamnose mutarotase
MTGVRRFGMAPRQEWWARTAPCQLPFEVDSPAPNRQQLDEAWHLD